MMTVSPVQASLKAPTRVSSQMQRPNIAQCSASSPRFGGEFDSYFKIAGRIFLVGAGLAAAALVGIGVWLGKANGAESNTQPPAVTKSLNER